MDMMDQVDFDTELLLLFVESLYCFLLIRENVKSEKFGKGEKYPPKKDEKRRREKGNLHEWDCWGTCIFTLYT